MSDAPLPPAELRAGLQLYDTTLRDGTQRPGINLTVEDKLTVARRMDELGVAYIEGGWPGANPKDTQFFARAAAGELELRHATLTAFGMTRMAGRAVDADPLVQGLVDAATEVVCLVGKSWGYHVDEALGVPRDENLAMVAETIEYLSGLGRRVFFDAEHFFDGLRRDGAYTREVAAAAADAGAECVVLCDTNGGTMPHEVTGVVRELVGALPCDVGLHFHDDGGCAVANTLLGVEAGGVQVQGTANGLGERCGNANLFTVMADLQLKRGLALVEPAAMEKLAEVSHHVAELCNEAPPSSQPYTGSAAFAHKAGLHASAMAKAPDMYQHVDPARVGNHQRLVVSELAGRSNVVLKAAEFGLELGRAQATQVLDEVKRREALGWTYEAADASFELLLRRVVGLLAPDDEPFRSRRYTVDVAGGRARELLLATADTDEHADATRTFAQVLEVDPDAPPPAEAVIRLEVDGERVLGAGEGNGPVDALDHAFRNAVNGRWPQLDAVALKDYKVRIIETTSGTEAVTRVLVTSSDGATTWDTVGVHHNVVEASWLALSDAYTHAILRPSWRRGRGDTHR